ncbi:mannonate dehydratase [Candidatus Sumerlaeota bacterium]|nr:mannonate dehydratase [Candidatus Sumerlaeota bacterium]
MKLAMMLPPTPSPRWKVAKQCGVNHAVTTVSPERTGIARAWDLDNMALVQKNFEAAGLKVAAIEGPGVPMNKIKLGLPGRDEEIEIFCALIRNAGELRIPTICYNFMAAIGWSRTAVNVLERGGALTSEFNQADAEKKGLTSAGVVSEDRMWENFTYFIRQVMPVAEKAGVQLGLHPDDPPLSPLQGIGRIIRTADAYQKAMRLAPSPMNGITFCQANFKLMGEDLEKIIREFGKKKKIFFVHFRDVRGTAQHFVETFHDNGPTNMAAMLRLYHEVGFEGPIRPDHAPILEGESNDDPGYGVVGKVFAFGYMRGIARAYNIPMA